MKKITFFKLIMMLSGLALISYSLMAVPARKRPVVKILPDGSTLTIVVHGDEYNHWITTPDDLTIEKDSIGFYYYLKEDVFTKEVTRSSIKAHDKPLIEEEKNLRKNTRKHLRQIPVKESFKRTIVQPANPNMGSYNDGWLLEDNPYAGMKEIEFIIVPISFTNEKCSYSKLDWERLVNTRNLKEWGLYGSVRDFFWDMSFGKLDVTAQVLDIYETSTVPGTNGTNLDREILNYVRSQPNIRYDECAVKPLIAVVFPGYSQSDTGDENDIWANQHAYLNQYDFLYTPEFDSYPDKLPGTYTFCHEFSHVLGIPDLYDTDYEKNGLGYTHTKWDVMVGGYWDRNPVGHNSFIRYLMGWVENAVELNTAQHVEMRTTQQDQLGYLYHTAVKGEFFWLENRQQEGWDQGIPNSGLTIYRVDSVQWRQTIYKNEVNAYADHLAFDLIEAGNCKDHSADASDVFPGILGNTAFTDTSIPNAKSLNGQYTGKPLNRIALNKEGMVSFEFINGNAPMNEVILSSLRFSGGNELNAEVRIIYGGEISSITEKGIYYGLTPTTKSKKVVDSGSKKEFTLHVTGLNPNMTYYVRPYLLVGGNEIIGKSMSIKTPLNHVELPFSLDFSNPKEMDKIQVLGDCKNEGNRLYIYDGEVIFPPMHVVAGVPVYFRDETSKIQGQTNDASALYYRETYDGEWILCENKASVAGIIPQSTMLQLRLANINSSGSYGNLTVTTDKNGLIADQYPFVIKENEPTNYLNHKLYWNKNGFKGDVITSYLNTMKLTHPALCVSLQLIDYTQGVAYDNNAIIKVETRNSIDGEWALLEEKFVSDLSSNAGFSFDLPREAVLQAKVTVLSAKSGEIYDCNAMVIGEKNVPFVRTGVQEGDFGTSLIAFVAQDISEVTEIGVEFDNIHYPAFEVRNYATCYIDCLNSTPESKVDTIYEGTTKKVTKDVVARAYQKNSHGQIIYGAPTSLHIEYECKSNQFTAHPVPLFGKKVALRGIYPVERPDQDVLLQGVCWKPGFETEFTITDCEGKIELESAEKYYRGEANLKESGYYTFRPFMMLSNGSYVYGEIVSVRFMLDKLPLESDRIGFPYTFENAPNFDLLWSTMGSGWNSYMPGVYHNDKCDKYLNSEYASLTSPIIQINTDNYTNPALYLDGFSINSNIKNFKLFVSVIDEKHDKHYELELFSDKPGFSDKLFALMPKGVSEFRLEFKVPNASGACNIAKVLNIIDLDITLFNNMVAQVDNKTDQLLLQSWRQNTNVGEIIKCGFEVCQDSYFDKVTIFDGDFNSNELIFSGSHMLADGHYYVRAFSTTRGGTSYSAQAELDIVNSSIRSLPYEIDFSQQPASWINSGFDYNYSEGFGGFQMSGLYLKSGEAEVVSPCMAVKDLNGLSASFSVQRSRQGAAPVSLDKCLMFGYRYAPDEDWTYKRIGEIGVEEEVGILMTGNGYKYVTSNVVISIPGNPYDVAIFTSPINDTYINIKTATFTGQTTNCTHTPVMREPSKTSTCFGEEILLEAYEIPNATYQWMMNNVAIPDANTSQYNATESGDYSVAVTLNGCTKATEEVHLFFHKPALSIDVTGELIACDGIDATLSVIEAYDSYLWSTGETTKSIRVTEKGDYSVTVTNAMGCSNSLTYYVGQTRVIAPRIKYISVENNHNVVVWSEGGPDVAAFNIYKEVGSVGNYELIGTVNGDIFEFEDINSDARVKTDQYKVMATDQCEGITDLSEKCKSVHLQINRGVANSWNLSWSDYQGECLLSHYEIWRGNTPDNMQFIDEVLGNTYSDFEAPADLPVYYKVIARLKDYTIYKTPMKTWRAPGNQDVMISSNVVNASIVDNLAEQKDQLNVSLAPNPVHDWLYIHSTEELSYVEIYDLSGVCLKVINIDLHKIDMSDLIAGTYFIRVRSANLTRSYLVIKE